MLRQVQNKLHGKPPEHPEPQVRQAPQGLLAPAERVVLKVLPEQVATRDLPELLAQVEQQEPPVPQEQQVQAVSLDPPELQVQVD